MLRPGEPLIQRRDNGPGGDRRAERLLRELDPLALIVMAASAAVMTAAASGLTIFDDEAFSCRRYVLPVDELLPALAAHVEPDPPLFYVAVHGWSRLFGLRPLGLRSLSIVLFLAGVAALGGAAACWFGGRAARCTVLLAALHPAHVLFGMAARWYSLMFLCVSMLMLFTARIVSAGDGASSPARAAPRAWWVAWTIWGAAACWTNYFGPCVVGLTWLALGAAVRRRDGLRPWLAAGVGVVVLYGAWLPRMFEQLQRFPRASHAPFDYAVAAARTLVSLATGNLAEPGLPLTGTAGAWWVWMPMAVAAVAILLLVVNGLRSLQALVWVAAGCFAAGVATLTMIDKYVMCFSPVVCLVVAGGLARGWTVRPRLACVAAGALAIAWAGCYVNLARGQALSSLRWTDPFESAVAEVAAAFQPGDRLVATHPSVRYYWAMVGLPSGRNAGVAEWIRRYDSVCAPATVLAAFEASSGPAGEPTAPRGRTWVIETASTSADAADLSRLASRLADDHDVAFERRWGFDAAAHRKDRLDPVYRHPEQRIVVRRFDPRR